MAEYYNNNNNNDNDNDKDNDNDNLVHLYSTHIHYLPEILYKTIPKNYKFTQESTLES